MAVKETIRGKIRGPKEVELEHALDLPIGSEISITISSSWNVSNLNIPNTFFASATDLLVHFKRAAGSWKDVPENFIKEVYADRHLNSRRDIVL